MTLTIASVDRIAKLRRGTLDISYAANARSTATFLLVDESRTSPYRPSLDDAVVIRSNAGTTLFQGVVIGIENAPLVHSYGAAVRVTCADYSQVAQRRMVIDALTTAVTTKGVLTELCATYQPLITVSASVASGMARTAMTFDMIRLDEVLTRICDDEGWIWDVRDTLGVLTLYAYAMGSRTPAAPANFASNDGTTRALTWTHTRDVGTYSTQVHIRYKNGSLTRPASPPATIYDEIVSAPDVETSAQATLIADAVLAQKAISPKTITIVTTVDGYLPGQSVTVTFPEHGLSGVACNVREVRTRDLLSISGGAYLEHTVELVETTYLATFGRHSLWRDFYRGVLAGSGAGGTSTTAAIAGTFTTITGGGESLYLGGSRTVSVTHSGSYTPVPNYVNVTIDTAKYVGATIRARVWLRTEDAGTSVTPQIYNLTDTTIAATGTAATNTTWSDLSPQTFDITLGSGAKLYQLRVLPSNANAGVYALGSLYVA